MTLLFLKWRIYLFIYFLLTDLIVYTDNILYFIFRNSGMGMVSVASRIGAASSPFVVQMTRINPILPFALMGGLSFIATVFCWILPETVGKRTAEVMGDSDEKEQGNHCFYVFTTFLYLLRTKRTLVMFSCTNYSLNDSSVLCSYYLKKLDVNVILRFHICVE